MISVTIYINNVPIITRSARNVGEVEGALGLHEVEISPVPLTPNEVTE